MFPSRYFNPRYWAARYWPKVGADKVVVTPTDLDGLTVKSVDQILGVTSIRETLTIRSIDRLTVRSVS